MTFAASSLKVAFFGGSESALASAGGSDGDAGISDS